MAENSPIVFKCEPSLWDMMVPVNPDGRSVKPFNMRRWAFSDDRILRLARGHIRDTSGNFLAFRVGPPLGRSNWEPDEKEVSFLNKATGELLTFEYLGVEFTPWAPGWGFLILGKRLSPPVEEDLDSRRD